MKTIVEEIELALKIDDGDRRRARSRASTTRRWVLMDYGDVIVHVFLDETREYYDLDRLWADAAGRRVADRRRAGDSQSAQSAQSR